MDTKSAPLIVIVGETGSGKSALAMEIAKRFNGEIVSADSWAVYREFNIGTAKPNTAERKLVPFHLIDVVDPANGFSAALFQRLANDAIADIHKQNKLPILVGGTGLYVDSILYDFSFLPPGAPGQRSALQNKTIPELLADIESADISTQGIDTRNKRRLIRLLETNGQRPVNEKLRPNTLILGITLSSEQLRQRVTQRVDEMIEHGLEKEVSQLAAKYGWDTEPMKGIGYREWREYFEGSLSLEQTRQRIISATMNLAKRQRTWFKRNKSIQWVNDPNKVVEIVTTFLNKKR
jgi:tRNA dimethylallyltransferase